MSFEVKVPSVGESITEVTIANLLKKDGELVNQDEIICELESDKATFEVPAPQTGVISWKVGAGDVVAIGGVICNIQNSVAPAPGVSNSNAPVEKPVVAPTGEVIEIKIPAVGESISEVVLSNWTKKSGDLINQGELLCEIESDKATFELTAEVSGYLQIVVEKGQTVPIGALVGRITKSEISASGSTAPAATPAEKAQEAQKVASSAGSAVTPLAAKILADKGISPAQVAGTGEGGKITKEDALKANPNQPVSKPAETPVSSIAPAAAGDRVSRREKLSSLRKTVARRLVAVKNETAMLTTFNEVDMKPIMDIRAKYKDKFKEKHQVGLGFMSFFTKAVCEALKEFPAVNAMIDGDEIIYNDYADVAIAVSAPKGLVVPVIRNAENLDLAGIEREVVRLAGKARDNKLSIEEMTGGTFTITNGGVFGSMMSTPIINAPQSAILGMHNIVDRAVVVNGEIVVRPIMYVALSYDHRIIDGRESVGFLVRVKQMLEDPMRLLLGV
ncbi:MAG TPA: 2-oxoglutarate dehydrogenase complex dihydrolipoyllysine-residue succinyltransferase [Catalimonadaceae bacterium]|nr:2-oxoglutarate dehydrogenase complex dihydrolipoyllysine-residue succinyltransferase [Catalimonadaceae bacterium]